MSAAAVIEIASEEHTPADVASLLKQGFTHVSAHRLCSQLRALDSEITNAFVELHKGIKFNTPEEAQVAADNFRADYLNRLIEKGAA